MRSPVGRVSSVFLVIALFSAGSVSGSDVTGTWDGTVSAIVRCKTGATLQLSGSASAGLTQTGDTFSGGVSFTVPIPDEDKCTLGAPITVGAAVSGKVMGDNLSGTITSPLAGSGPFTGTIMGDTMSITASADGSTVSLSLRRTSGTPPDSRYSGFYGGGYSATISGCCKLALVSYSGGLSGNIVHSGTTITGTLIATKSKGDREDASGACTLVDTPDQTVALFGQLSGNTITGFLIAEGDEPQLFFATITGDTISGQVVGGGCPGESVSFSITRGATPPPPSPPTVSSFAANPSTINAGESSTLTWSTVNATGVTIDNGVGAQPANGSVSVAPTQTTTYTLTATGSGGTATATTTVTVTAPTPRVVVGSTPRGMAQLAGQGGGADAFTLTNIGTAQTTVALTKSGDFFTIAPTSATLGPGATQTITITGLAQGAGSFEGTATASGPGAAGLTVTVRLLSSAPPTGTVRPQPTQARAEINASAGQNVSGSVPFTNTGNATMQAIAVSDVPWIIPQSGIITIGAGQTVQVSYTIDSSKRPDADAPLGAVTGALSLIFLSGTSGPTASDNAPGTSQVSVTLVYVVKPGTTAGAPSPLAANEVALFVPGLANRSNAVGDFLLSNRQSSASLGDVKLYLLAPGAAPQLANLPVLPAGASALFPSLLKNVFALSAQTGTAQVRASDTSKVSVAGIQSNTSSPRGTFSTPLPVFRSDRGVSSGGQLVLAGLVKDGSVQTNIYVQELLGTVTTAQIDLLDATGNVVASRTPQSVESFGLLEVLDAAPAGAVAARVRNVSGGRIGAYALVTNSSNGEAWLVTDPSVESTADGTFIVPVLSAGAGAEIVLFGTNRSGAPISATIDTHGSGRRRALGKPASGGNGMAPVSHATSSVPLNSMQSFTQKIVSTATGYIRLTMPAGSLSAVGRTFRSDPGQPAYGSGLPAIPISAALRAGESRRFAGVDDASPASRVARTPATFRSNLMLIETANQPAVVRVTLRYTFAAGTTVSARAVSTRAYSLNPLQFVMINGVIGDVIGGQRSTFGDLRNIDVDVEVVSGGGVIPVLQSVDNGSDDSVVRIN